MPPKKSGKAAAKRKPKPGDQSDLEFLHSLAPEYVSEGEFRQLATLFKSAREKRQKDVLQACGVALERICADMSALITLKDSGCLPAIASAAADPLDGPGKLTRHVVEHLCQGASSWLEKVDPIDFTEISTLMYFSHHLGGVDVDIAGSAVAAITRFANHRPEHTVSMLEAGALKTLHGLLSVHRGPEFVEEVFRLLRLICDLPPVVVWPHLEVEMDLITTILELISNAPLNMRLQVSGFRLLGVLSQRNRNYAPEVGEMIRKGDARSLLEDAVQKLQYAGFPDHAAWLRVIAGRTVGVAC